MLPGIIWHTWSSVGEQEERQVQKEKEAGREGQREKEKRELEY